MNRIRPVKVVSPLAWHPVWLDLDETYFRLCSPSQIELACRLVCIEHNRLETVEKDEVEEALDSESDSSEDSL